MSKNKLIKKVKKPKKLTKLPSVWALLKTAWFECITFWRPLLGVVAVYAILQFIFVLGMSFNSTINDSLITSTNRFSEAITSVFSAFGNSGVGSGSQSDATVLMQYLLFIITSMAFIWTLRKLQSLKAIKLRDAYYEGTSALIPTILVTLVFTFALVPAVIGSGILSIVLQAVPTGLEILIFSGATGLAILFSFYLFATMWPAFYIVSLPQTKPIQAIKLAAKTTKNRRFAILRKMVALAIVSLLAIFIVLLPIALVLPSIIPASSFIVLFIVFGYCHVYLYNLYRSLL